MMRRSVRGSVRDPGALLTFSQLPPNCYVVKSETRVRRSVVSAEAERVRSSWKALHGPSLQCSKLSGRVEGITGPPGLVCSRDVLRVVR